VNAVISILYYLWSVASALEFLPSERFPCVTSWHTSIYLSEVCSDKRIPCSIDVEVKIEIQ